MKRAVIDFHLDKVYPFLVSQRNEGNETLNSERSIYKNEREQDDEGDLDKETQSQDTFYQKRDTRQQFLTQSNTGVFVAETTQSLMGQSQSRYGLGIEIESGLELTKIDSTGEIKTGS